MRSSMFIVRAIWLSLLFCGGCTGWIAQSAAHGHGTHKYGDKRGAVASESAVCSKIGVGLIEQGGNAADAVRALLKRRSYDHQY